MPKRKASSAVPAASVETASGPPLPPLPNGRRSKAVAAFINSSDRTYNPRTNVHVIDGPHALRASPDHVNGKVHFPGAKDDPESSLSDLPENEREEEPPPKKKRQTRAKDAKVVEITENGNVKSTKAAVKKKSDVARMKEFDNDEPPVAVKDALTKSGPNPAASGDPEAEGDELEEADPEELKASVGRPPPVHSDYLPLPWKGRLGYACLNTYLRNCNPPVFCSRTTRIASILEHRHPLKDPLQPEHSTKNRPDKDQPAEVWRGQKFVEQLALANVRDIIKLVRWNERYGIRFFRLSSEMFPFASHAEYGYRLSTFASEALAEAGKIIAKLGHRVTMHPGQFTQLGSPREQVITASFRDLEYHDELLSLLKLPEKQNRDAVLILHMGGAFGDKAATLQRFRENYATLSDSIKRRLVLENDDMSWNVHDLLPICEELNIPFVLDFHHHNIIFNSEKIREGTKDIIDLFPRIKKTWTRKGITQKMHYSEPRPGAITPTQRRRHNPRVMTLPPCSPDMDLMIEAKDKEQAVFELMRTFKLPGWNRFNDVIPFVRSDDNKILDADGRKKEQAAQRKRAKAAKNGEDEELVAVEGAEGPPRIPEEDVGMGGPDGRVYWPVGMEDWLRPPKRVVKKKEMTEAEKSFARTPAGKKKAAATATANGKEEEEEEEEERGNDFATASSVKRESEASTSATRGAVMKKAAPKRSPAKGKKVPKKEATPTTSEDEREEMEVDAETRPAKANGATKKTRAKRAPAKNYAVDLDEDDV